MRYEISMSPYNQMRLNDRDVWLPYHFIVKELILLKHTYFHTHIEPTSIITPHIGIIYHTLYISSALAGVHIIGQCILE